MGEVGEVEGDGEGAGEGVVVVGVSGGDGVDLGGGEGNGKCIAAGVGLVAQVSVASQQIVTGTGGYSPCLNTTLVVAKFALLLSMFQCVQVLLRDEDLDTHRTVPEIRL